MTQDIVGDSLAYLAERLPGLTITGREAVRFASAWWDATGRHLIDKAFNRDRADTFSHGRGTASIRVKGSPEVVVPSRILEGCPWAELGRRERMLVVKHWLEFNRENYMREAPKAVVL